MEIGIVRVTVTKPRGHVKFETEVAVPGNDYSDLILKVKDLQEVLKGSNPSGPQKIQDDPEAKHSQITAIYGKNNAIGRGHDEAQAHCEGKFQKRIEELSFEERMGYLNELETQCKKLGKSIQPVS